MLTLQCLVKRGKERDGLWKTVNYLARSVNWLTWHFLNLFHTSGVRIYKSVSRVLKAFTFSSMPGLNSVLNSDIFLLPGCCLNVQSQLIVFQARVIFQTATPSWLLWNHLPRAGFSRHSVFVLAWKNIFLKAV